MVLWKLVNVSTLYAWCIKKIKCQSHNELHEKEETDSVIIAIEKKSLESKGLISQTLMQVNVEYHNISFYATKFSSKFLCNTCAS